MITSSQSLISTPIKSIIILKKLSYPQYVPHLLLRYNLYHKAIAIHLKILIQLPPQTHLPPYQTPIPTSHQHINLIAPLHPTRRRNTMMPPNTMRTTNPHPRTPTRTPRRQTMSRTELHLNIRFTSTSLPRRVITSSCRFPETPLNALTIHITRLHTNRPTEKRVAECVAEVVPYLAFVGGEGVGEDCLACVDGIGGGWC
jgi:hypothetical protein